NLGLILTPESEVSLLLDRRFGDQIKGTGHGNLNLTLSREGNLALTGNYVFEQGNYSFNLVNLVNKNFEIKKGGRIDWNGDPYAGNMQMEAVYKQRASIRNLLGNNLTGQNDNRNILPVETYLDLTGPILQPGVKFRLNLPTVNTNNPNDILVQQITRINNNEQELNSQVLGLLVSGQFIPSENLNSANLGISTGATAFNSVTEMLTTRLSNLLNNSLGGGLNFGINYRGDLGTGILNSGNNANSVADSNRRDLNVALNTSLFGNRLVIDGNLAMGNSLQVNSRNMAGEINVEYLINPSGTVRAKAFNRPDDRILFNQSQNLNYRQGIGLSYNRNFNRWSELLRKNPRQ
ncbi:MAG: translocation/assembly module TamB domain-containing protein, partial [Bacteroidota bacterium]